MPTLALRYCSLTLDALSRITGISACGLAGVSGGAYAECLLFDCNKRTQIWQAVRDAQSLIAEHIDGPMCDDPRTLPVTVGYWAIPQDWLLETRRTEDVVFAVEVPEELAAPPCMTLITLRGEIIIEECEQLVNAEIKWDGCICPHLATEFCQADYEVLSVDPETGAQTIEVVLVTRAYNLNDTDGTVSGDDLDWLPDEVTVTLTVALPVSEATVFWQHQPTCCPTTEEDTCTVKGCCHLQECCACIQRDPTGIVWAMDWRNCCLQTCCQPFPHHFEIGAVVPGLWRDGWAQAVVSLMNNLLPQDWCSCNPMANLRYMRDTGVDNGTQRPDAMFYANPFGIFTAGAKQAWHTVGRSTEKPLIVSI